MSRANIKVRWAVHNARQFLWDRAVGVVVLATTIIDQRRYVVRRTTLDEDREAYS